VLIEFKMREELKRRGVDPAILNKEDEVAIPLKKVSGATATSKPLASVKVDKVSNGFVGLSYANAKQFMPVPASVIGADVESAKSLSELKMAVQNDVQKLIKGNNNEN